MSQTTDPGNDAPSLSFLLEEVGRRFAALQAENATLRKALQAAEHLQVASADDLTETRARLEISDQAAITSEKENITTQAAAQAAAATSCSDHLASEVALAMSQKQATGVRTDLVASEVVNKILGLANQRFRRLIEATPNAVVMIDQSGQIEMVNAEMERVFGYSRAELVGQQMEMLVPERFRDHHSGLRATFFRHGRMRPMAPGHELYCLRKDGSEFPSEIGLTPIETDEGTMVLAAIVDMSTRKREEARVHVSHKKKDILLAEIHHRVKNNLQIVDSLLGLQSGNIDDIGVQDILRESQNRIKSMALIHQILYQSNDFARMDFSNFLDSLVPTLASSYGADPARIVLSIIAVDVRLPLGMAIPCGLLVNELISNALKHAFPGDRHGEIKIDLSIASDGHVLLAVEDDGVGIPDDLDLDQTATLGLQLVMLLTDQIGGRMVIRRSNPIASRCSWTSLPGSMHHDATRVIVVEDERIVALYLRQQLLKLGYEVAGVAASGERALRLVSDVRRDVVLMDIHIDGPMDGIETTEQMPADLLVPVII